MGRRDVHSRILASGTMKGLAHVVGQRSGIRLGHTGGRSNTGGRYVPSMYGGGESCSAGSVEGHCPHPNGSRGNARSDHQRSSNGFQMDIRGPSSELEMRQKVRVSSLIFSLSLVSIYQTLFGTISVPMPPYGTQYLTVLFLRACRKAFKEFIPVAPNCSFPKSAWDSS